MSRIPVMILVFTALLAFKYDDWFLRGLQAKKEIREVQENWAVTYGRVIRSGIRYSSPEMKSSATPDIVVKFEVDGEWYENRTPWLDAHIPYRYPLKRRTMDYFGGRDPRRYVPRHYSMGLDVPVYYNPVNPRQSLLEDQVPEFMRWRVWTYIGLGIADAGLILFLLLSFLGVFEAKDRPMQQARRRPPRR